MVNDVNIQGSLFADEPRRDTATCKSRREIHEDYDGFVEKFKPRKTTDDCYTPQPVYDAVLGWLRENADIEGREIVRPFWPGGDYEHYDYPDGCVVVDNPPFSIFTQVCRFFQSRNISFFSVRAASDVAQSGRHELDRHSVRRSGDIRKRGMRRYVVCQQPFRRHSYYDRARPARPHQKCRKNEATTYGFAKIHLPGQCGIRRIVGQDSPLRQIRGAGVRMSKGPQTR